MESTPKSQIQNFYDDQTIFVTGATGFLGKLLVEKLLRTCYDLKTIYILMRDKKEKNCEARFKQYFDDPLYDRLKTEHPESLKKLSIMTGDLQQPNMGLSPENQTILKTEVNSIFHLAATIRFDEEISIATQINIKATYDILQLAKQAKNLKSFVHVSTAFAFCPRENIDEVVYKPGIRAEELLKMVEQLDKKQLECMLPSLLDKWPNTYSFTKAVSEELVKRVGADLPLAIVRPSIVVVTAKEPIVGWMDNYYGTTGLILSASLGVLRTLVYEPKYNSDLVPADYAINCVIAAGWDVYNRRNSSRNGQSKEVPVYNYVSGARNPITWGRCSELVEEIAPTVPSVKNRWHYFVIGANTYPKFLLLHFLLHIIPGFIQDTARVFTGKKPMVLKMYNKIRTFVKNFTYFTTTKWIFRDDNTEGLWKKLDANDKKLFEFDIASLNWNEYFKDYVTGMRVHLVKDPIDTLPHAKRKAFKLKIVHYVVSTILVILFLKLGWACLNSFTRLVIGI